MSRLATRLTVAVVGITAGTVLVAALAMWWSLRAVRYADVDRELNERVERMRRFDAMAGRWRGPRPPDGRGGQPPAEVRTGQPLAEVRTGQPLAEVRTGQPLAEVRTGQPLAEVRTGQPPGEGRGGPPRLTHIITADGSTIGNEPEIDLRPSGEVPKDGWHGTVGRIRVAAVAITHVPGGTEDAHLTGIALIGEDLSGIDGELRRMAIGLSMLWLVATALAIAAAITLRRAVLRPLACLGSKLSKLSPDDLSARLSLGAAPDEVRALVERLNTLLAGLEEAFRREQATIANIAHELRTPVAGLRTEIEFRLLASPDAAEQSVLRGLLSTVGRMQAMVGNILMLARIEAGRERLAAEPLDLAPLVEAAVERWEARAAGRGQEIVCTIEGAARLATSGVHLDVVLDNLLGNAVAHGGAGTIAVTVAGGTVSVANPCHGTIDAARLGTAFYRADEARSDGAHCGLGLALCRRIAELLGARLDLELADGRFTARLAMTPA